jgi:hypothetical protein
MYVLFLLTFFIFIFDSDPVEGPSQKRQQVDDESNDDSGTDYDVFLDDKVSQG